MAANTPLLEDYIPYVKYHGFNTDKDVDLGGTLNVDGAVTLGGAITVTGAQTFTGAATFNGGIDASGSTLKYKRNVLASSGNTTMTSAMSGSVMLIDGASTDYTLPAIAAGDVGMYFTFYSTIISTGTQTITAGAADLLTGSIAIINAGAVGSDTFSPDVTDDLIITLNGTTTGGVAVGSWCRLTAISATRWFVEGVFNGSGTLATPFS